MALARKPRATVVVKKRTRRNVTPNERAEILALSKRKMPVAEIARKFHRHDSVIYHVINMQKPHKTREPKHNLKEELDAANEALHEINNGPPDRSQIDEQIQKLLEMAALNGKILSIRLDVNGMVADVDEFEQEEVPLK